MEILSESHLTPEIPLHPKICTKNSKQVPADGRMLPGKILRFRAFLLRRWLLSGLQCLAAIICLNSATLAAEPLQSTNRSSAGDRVADRPATDLVVSALADGILSPKEAVSIALARNPRLSNLEQNIEGAQLSAERADAEYASDLSVQGRYNARAISSGQNTGNSSNSSFLDNEEETSIAVNLDLPWWHKTPEKKEAAKAIIDIELEQLKYDSFEKDLTLDVFTTYLSVVFIEEKLAVARETLSFVRNRRDSIASGMVVGKNTREELIAEETNLLDQQAEINLLDLERIDKREQLFEMMGIAANSADTCNQILRAEEYDSAALPIEDAITENTQFIMLQIKKNEIEVERLKQNWFPRLSLQGQYQRESDSIGFSGDSGDEIFVGISGTIPLPNFGLRNAERRIAAHDLNQLYRNLAQIETNTRNEVQRLVDRISSLAARTLLLQELIKKQDEKVDVTRQNFDLGRITNIEVQLVEDESTQTKKDYYATLLEHGVAVARLNRIYGKLPRLTEHCAAGEFPVFLNQTFLSQSPRFRRILRDRGWPLPRPG